jgi:hypothetical protein
VRGLLARSFPEVDAKYFFHVLGMWAVFVFLLWLGHDALGRVHDGGARGVLAIFVVAVVLGAPAVMHWFWQRSP